MLSRRCAARADAGPEAEHAGGIIFLSTVAHNLTFNHKLTSTTNMSMAMQPKRTTTDRFRPAYLSTLCPSMIELTSCA